MKVTYGLGMDALVIGIIRKRTEFWFGHGCSGKRTHQKMKVTSGWGMDALVSALIKRGK